MKNIDEEEKYDYRQLKYPLLNKKYNDIIEMTKKLPFKPVYHSLECQPCIHSTMSELKMISKKDICRVNRIEEKTKSFMFNGAYFNSLNKCFSNKENIMEELSKACSWEYSCGL